MPRAAWPGPTGYSIAVMFKTIEESEAAQQFNRSTSSAEQRVVEVAYHERDLGHPV
jgi:hypothetical protein